MEQAENKRLAQEVIQPATAENLLATDAKSAKALTSHLRPALSMDLAASQQTPIPNSGELGRFKSIEAKQRSLKNLKAPRRPGDPPLNPNNLGGRPPKDGPASRELRKLLRKKFPGDPVERTYMQLMIEGLVKAAIKGSTLAAALIFERLEGRLPLPVESEMPANITVIVNRNQPRYPEIDQQGLMLEANTSTKKSDD